MSAIPEVEVGIDAQRAQIIGLGLIGGSIGLALRARGWLVTGSDVDPEVTKRALNVGAIDAAGTDGAAQVVFVATPVAFAAQCAQSSLNELGDPTVVVTDVSSVKEPVVRNVEDSRFVGGHPMAGSEQVGLDGADPNLFVGATWVLTPTERTAPEAFVRLQGVIGSLGADVVALNPADHDRMVALVSHVPHLVAATLMNAAALRAESEGTLLRLAAGGFRDMTRVAAGHPGIWPDICVDNAAAIVAGLDQVLADLEAMRDRVARGDRTEILDTLERAAGARRALPGPPTRPEHLCEVRIPVPDREGVLAELTTVASDLGVNIYDVEIAHSSEGPRGVLVLIVDQRDADRLRGSIDGVGYRSVARSLA
jgi:prephenate dehydrogenase